MPSGIVISGELLDSLSWNSYITLPTCTFQNLQKKSF